MVSLPRPSQGFGTSTGTSKAVGSVRINEQAFHLAKERLRKAAKVVHQHRVTIGIHEDQSEQAKVDYKGHTTHLKLVEAAAIQEFGAGPIPARSFIRDWFDQHRSQFLAEMKEAIKKELEGYTTGLERSQAITDFAQRLLDGLKARMEEGLSPELADSTVRAREAAGLPGGPPLIATKQLINAIGAKVDGFLVAGGTSSR